MPFFVLSARGSKKPEIEGIHKLKIDSKGLMTKFAFLKVLNGLGDNVFFGLLPYYVYRRFGAGSDELGIVLSATMLINALANIFAPKISGKIGTLKAIALSLGLCVPLYFMVAFAPNFAILSLILLVRTFLANISSPLSTSLYMRLLSDHEKGMAASISNMASMSSGAIGTRLESVLMGGDLRAPIYVGASIFVAYSSGFWLLLRNETIKH
jgi:MFS family permease